jgi:hypothetical protein
MAIAKAIETAPYSPCAPTRKKNATTFPACTCAVSRATVTWRVGQNADHAALANVDDPITRAAIRPNLRHW